MNPQPNEVFAVLDARFPFASAYDWDNSGWQVTGARPVERCLVALDPSPAAIERAIGWDAQLIVTHHPLFFPNLQFVDAGSERGVILRVLLERGIGLIAAHTNADRHPKGISGALADTLELDEQTVLVADTEAPYYKLITFIPDDDLAAVRRALTAAGAGVIGNYAECSFSLAGIGTYMPQKGAKPLSGEIGKLEEAAEQRLEMRVPERRVGEVLAALKQAHPYDEVAYDLYRTHHQGEYLGIGIVGTWPAGVELKEALGRVKKALGGVPLRVTGPEEGLVATVAVVGGSADDFVPAAVARGADLFVGGDLKYHNRQEAASHMVCVDAGHRATEQPGVVRLAETIRSAAASSHWDLEVEVFQETPSPERIV